MSKANIVALAALKQCQEKFEFYQQQHEAKGTSDADAKAIVNAHMAVMCAEAVTEITRHLDGVRVRVRDTGLRGSPVDPVVTTYILAAVPRVGDSWCYEDQCGAVKGVLWLAPGSVSNFDVEIRVW